MNQNYIILIILIIASLSFYGLLRIENLKLLTQFLMLMILGQMIESWKNYGVNIFT